LTTLADAKVGDTVTIEFEVTETSAGLSVGIRNAAWVSQAAFSTKTTVKSISKGPKFKIGDRVSADVVVNYRNVTKHGTIKFLDGKRAWVEWDAVNFRSAYETLMALSNLRLSSRAKA
jgi:hypothetical protein